MHANPLPRWRLAAPLAVLALLGTLPPSARADGPPGGCRLEAGLRRPPPDLSGPADLPPVPGRSHPMPPPGMEPMPPHWRGLGLDEAQQDRVFALVHERMPARREQMRAAAVAPEELRRLAAGGEFDATRARSLADAHGRAVAALALMEAELDARVRVLLSAEQRAALDRHAGRSRQP